MTPQPPEPQSASDKLIEQLPNLIVTGGGGYGLYCLMTNDVPKALLSGIFAIAAAPLTSFGQGFIDKLKEKMKQRGEALGETVNNTLDLQLDFRKKYQEALKAYCGAVEVEGFQDLPGLALNDVFVPLHIQSESSQWQEPGHREIWSFLPARQLKPEQFPHRRIVILAAPGYGKTTLLRYLTFTYLTKAPDNTPRFIPVLLRLREIYTQISALPVGQNAEAETVLDLPRVISRHLEKPEYALKPSPEWFDTRLNQGECLVMLDGLDEVPNAQRQAVRQWVDTQMKKYRRTQFILTSRPHGFELQADEPSHPIQVDLKLRVLDFTPPQKREFIHNWCNASFWRSKWEPLLRDNPRKPPEEQLSEASARAKSKQEAQESADALCSQVVTTPALNELAKNPLLITMIAATHHANPEPARRRIELYDKICNLLLSYRPFTKNTLLTLTATQNKTVLQTLAWNLVQREITQFNPAQGSEWIQETLLRCAKNSEFDPSRFFKEMLETTGLLIEKESGRYEFSHQTFQEYFAALFLKEKDQYDRLLDNLMNDRWREVICFYAAMGDASPLINALLDGFDELSAEQKQYGLELANRCKIEGREVDLETRDRLEAILLQSIQQDREHIGIGRIELNSSLDVRVSVTVVEAQTLQLTAEVLLDQRFRHPIALNEKTDITWGYITQGEYQQFLADQAAGQFHSTAQALPYSQDLNQPVTDISWESARWFCAWLATQTQLQSDDNVYFYRLPTEDELRQLKKQTHNHPYVQAETRHLNPWTDPPQSSGNSLLVVREQLSNRYRNLLNYLANASWRDADQETYRLMITTLDKQEANLLKPEDLETFPCEDLRMLDRLWVTYSNGKWGFSVQKHIWEECGSPMVYNAQWRTFGSRVGWCKDNEWIKYDKFTFDLQESLSGEFPGVGVWWWSWKVGCYLFSRAKTCGL